MSSVGFVVLPKSIIGEDSGVLGYADNICRLDIISFLPCISFVWGPIILLVLEVSPPD